MESIIPIPERFGLGPSYTDKEEAKQSATDGQVVITNQKGTFYVTSRENFYNGLFQLKYEIV